MRRAFAVWVAAVCLVTVALVAPPGVASATAGFLEHVETLERGAPSSATPDESGACSGFAPLRPVCTTGVYQADWAFVSMGLSASNYEGTLENRLDWGDGALVLRCDIQGATAQCSFTGPFPPNGVLLVHNCRSHQLGTSVPGGSGSWACNFTAG